MKLFERIRPPLEEKFVSSGERTLSSIHLAYAGSGQCDAVNAARGGERQFGQTFFVEACAHFRGCCI